MIRRILLYLAVLTGCLIFYDFHRQWLAWLLLLSVAALPAISILLSLPAMLTLRLQPETPGTIPLGDACTVKCRLRCKFPIPPIRCRFLLRERSTGQQLILRPGKEWKPEHCGIWDIRPHRCRILDYLGLLPLPVKNPGTATLCIHPVPIPMEIRLPQQALQAKVWKPKPGGGFGENHDLRLYRPGDSLNHIHWKMSAKTGKLIYREPMEPVGNEPMLLLHLSGSRDLQDRKLGQFLWLSSHLLARQITHTLQCLTGSGLLACSIASTEDLRQALHAILSKPAATGDAEFPPMPHGHTFLIGGDGDEA